MTHRILVLDDEASFCEILQINLMKDGYIVDTAASAEEALDMDLSVYSLFVVDITMDQIDGFEFVRRLNSKLDTKMAPVIFCSALSSEECKVRGLDLGADDYITKPFDLRTVSRRVKSVLRRSYPELEQQ